MSPENHRVKHLLSEALLAGLENRQQDAPGSLQKQSNRPRGATTFCWKPWPIIWLLITSAATGNRAGLCPGCQPALFPMGCGKNSPAPWPGVQP